MGTACVTTMTLLWDRGCVLRFCIRWEIVLFLFFRLLLLPRNRRLRHAWVRFFFWLGWLLWRSDSIIRRRVFCFGYKNLTLYIELLWACRGGVLRLLLWWRWCLLNPLSALRSSLRPTISRCSIFLCLWCKIRLRLLHFLILCLDILLLLKILCHLMIGKRGCNWGLTSIKLSILKSWRGLNSSSTILLE